MSRPEPGCPEQSNACLATGPLVTGEGPVAVGTVGPPVLARQLVGAAPVGRIRSPAHHGEVRLRALDLPNLGIELGAAVIGAGNRGARLCDGLGGGFAYACIRPLRLDGRTATDQQRDEATAQPKTPGIQDGILPDACRPQEPSNSKGGMAGNRAVSYVVPVAFALRRGPTRPLLSRGGGASGSGTSGGSRVSAFPKSTTGEGR